MVRELVRKNLTLNADKTFTLSHQYNTAGNYNVSVVVTDDQHATGTTLTSVVVMEHHS